jgi:Integrase core domain
VSAAAGIRVSMGSKGDAYDNAVAESFFASLEKDLLRRDSFPTRQEARTAVFDYIETFYNPIRLHSMLDYPVTGRVRENETERRTSSLVTACPPKRGRSISSPGAGLALPQGPAGSCYSATAPRGENFSRATYRTPPGATSFAMPPLPATNTYYFVVRARDRAGNREHNRVERRGLNPCV